MVKVIYRAITKWTIYIAMQVLFNATSKRTCLRFWWFSGNLKYLRD